MLHRCRCCSTALRRLKTIGSDVSFIGASLATPTSPPLHTQIPTETHHGLWGQGHMGKRECGASGAGMGLAVRGDMVIFKNAKNTQTTAWRVLTEPTEDTCKALASVEAPTLRNTYDFPPIFPNLAAISLLPLSKRLTPYLPRHPAVVK